VSEKSGAVHKTVPNATAKIFFATNLLSAISYLIAARIAARIGLINTMVFTHLPANVCLMIVPFVDDLGLAVMLLLIRSLLSQMDVPTRTSYVMAVVTPAERPAAASVTAVPRSLASRANARRVAAGREPVRLAAVPRRRSQGGL